MNTITSVDERTCTNHGGAGRRATPSQRTTWRMILIKWHWVSSAVCLVCMLFFAFTGITLNNAEYFESSTSEIVHHSDVLPAPSLAELNVSAASAKRDLPKSVQIWMRRSFDVRLPIRRAEWRENEVFVDLARPGVDAWLSIDRKTGLVQYESDDHGWVAFFNDLHRGKNAGSVWGWLITLFGSGCIVFSVTGLLILRLHAKSRWSVWPVIGLGAVIPLLLILIFIS
jgi:uncharacterized protein